MIQESFSEIALAVYVPPTSVRSVRLPVSSIIMEVSRWSKFDIFSY